MIWLALGIVLAFSWPAQAQPANCAIARAALAFYTQEQLSAMVSPELRAKYQHCFKQVPKRVKWRKTSR
jgi:hypothetical protein